MLYYILIMMACHQVFKRRLVEISAISERGAERCGNMHLIREKKKD